MENPFVRKITKEARQKADELASHANQQIKVRSASRIAITFVAGYFFFLFTILLIGYKRCWTVEEYKEIFIATTALLSSPLSFILGYFFKNETNNKTT